MANEFIARKGLISLGDSQVTGSLETTSNLNVEGSGSFGNNKFLIGSNVPSNASSGFNSTFEFQNGPSTYSSQLVFRPKGNQVNYNASYWGAIRWNPGNEQGLTILAGNYKTNILFGKGAPSSANPQAFAKLNNDGLRLQSSYIQNIASAEEKLHVVGNAKITGFVTASGNLITEANITASGHVSASTYYGDGSNLTSLPTQDPFPYTGSAVISGSLEVIGNTTVDGKIDVGDSGNNTIVGNNAGVNVSTGTTNTFVGYSIGAGITTEIENTIIGNYITTNAGSNAAVNIGRAITNTGQNTLIGKQLTSTGGNSILIGYNKSHTAAGTVDIGYGGTGPVLIKGTASSTGTGTVAIGGAAGNYQVAIGLSSAATSGLGIAIGHPARTTNGVSIGGRAGQNNSTGTGNTLIGSEVGWSSGVTQTYSNTVAIGEKSLRVIESGNGNVAIGYNTGYNNKGAQNIFIGYQAGYNEIGSNKLYIENSNSTTPLIYGEFDNNKVLINGELSASSAISASTYYGDGSNLTGISSDPFPYTGSAVISGSLSLEGSGSTIFDVVGSQGQLFSITDSLSGSLFAVSDITGLPILEVFSNDTVKIGSFNDEAITVSGSHTTIGGTLAIPGFTDVSSSLATIPTIANDANNRVTTAVGDGTLNAESKLTFENSNLFVESTNVASGGVKIFGGTYPVSNAYISPMGIFTTMQFGDGSTGHIFDLQNNKLAFDADSTNTYIQADTDTPENLEIHADGNIELRADDELQIFSDVDVTGDITSSGDLSISGFPSVSASLAAASGGGGSAYHTWIGGRGENTSQATYGTQWRGGMSGNSLGGSFVVNADSSMLTVSAGTPSVGDTTSANNYKIITALIHPAMAFTTIDWYGHFRAYSNCDGEEQHMEIWTLDDVNDLVGFGTTTLTFRGGNQWTYDSTSSTIKPIITSGSISHTGTETTAFIVVSHVPTNPASSMKFVYKFDFTVT